MHSEQYMRRHAKTLVVFAVHQDVCMHIVCISLTGQRMATQNGSDKPMLLNLEFDKSSESINNIDPIRWQMSV